ncbi:MAG: SMI1/KNR4 family protein [Planctomycetota bacterium]
MSILERVSFTWVAQGLTAIKSSEFDAVESKCGVQFTKEFREFHRRVGGVSAEKNTFQDESGFSFWPLANVALLELVETDWVVRNGSKHVLFCDYLGMCWGYSLHYNRTVASDFQYQGIYIVGTETKVPQKVCDSFFEFLAFYLDDNGKLYPE